MNSSLDISQISDLSAARPLSNCFIYEISLLSGIVIAEGESRIQAAPSMITVFKSGNTYSYNQNRREGFGYTPNQDCFLVNERLGTAVMLWRDEESYRNEKQEFHNTVFSNENENNGGVPTNLTGGGGNPTGGGEHFPEDTLVTIQGHDNEDIAGTLREMFVAPEEITPAAAQTNATTNQTVSTFKTISPTKIDSMALIGDISLLDNLWFVAFSLNADNPYWNTGLASEFSFIDSSDDPRNPIFAIRDRDGKVFPCQALVEGNFASQLDESGDCRLFLFATAADYQESIFDLAQIFATQAPSELFRLAASLQDTPAEEIQTPESEPVKNTQAIRSDPLNSEQTLLKECLNHLSNNEAESSYTREELLRMLSLYR